MLILDEVPMKPDVDTVGLPADDVMHFVKAIKEKKGERLIAELNHLQKKRLNAMGEYAAKHGLR